MVSVSTMTTFAMNPDQTQPMKAYPLAKAIPPSDGPHCVSMTCSTSPSSEKTRTSSLIHSTPVYSPYGQALAHFVPSHRIHAVPVGPLCDESRTAAFWSLTVRPATSRRWYCLPSTQALVKGDSTPYERCRSTTCWLQIHRPRVPQYFVSIVYCECFSGRSKLDFVQNLEGNRVS